MMVLQLLHIYRCSNATCRWRNRFGLPTSRGFVNGKNIRTVEYLDWLGDLDPMQHAFIETGAFRCGL